MDLRRFLRAYGRLHELGYVHSLEAWREERLVGGLYGVALGRAFMAESMFHREPDAGNVALVAGAWHLRRLGFELFDVQFSSEHLAAPGRRGDAADALPPAAGERAAAAGRRGRAVAARRGLVQAQHAARGAPA